ncbi:MAG: hypothetical protein ACOY37_13830 [Pseudomonadota bacterium]
MTPLAVALALTLCACATSRASRPPSPQSDDAASASLAPVLAPDYGPLHEAKVGPYRFRVPAAYFRFQSGPYFDGSWGVHVLWPNLGPVPLGRLREQTVLDQAHDVSIDFSYIDKIDIRQKLDRHTRPFSDTPETRDDPSESFSGRIRGEAVHGLTPWRVDVEAYRRYANKYYPGNPRALEPRNRDDWYVAYSPDGQLRTLIVCDSSEIPEQYVIEGRRLRYLGGVPAPGCTHTFNLLDRKIAIDMSYSRGLLRDWALFEKRAVELFDTFLVKD